MPAFSVPDNFAFDSYTDLVSAIEDWMDRSDLTGAANSMIALAESRMRRLLVPLFSEVSASVVSMDGIAALPTDFGTLNRVLYNGETLSQLATSTAPQLLNGSRPYVYTMEANGLRVWPAGDFTLAILYQPTLPQLSEASPTNALLSQHPDLYFFGAMLFAEGYVANDNRAATFKALWDEAIAELQNYLTRQKYAGPLAPRVAFNP